MNQSRKRTPKEVRGSLLGTLLGDSYITQGNQFGCEQITKELIEIKKWHGLKLLQIDFYNSRFHRKRF